MENILTKIAAVLLAFSGAFSSVQGMYPENSKNRNAVVMRLFKDELYKIDDELYEIDVERNPEVGKNHVIYILGWDTTEIKFNNIPEKDEIERLFIGKGITAIEDFAFSRCQNLYELCILGNPKLGSSVFQHCYCLTKVTANNITQLKSGCFENCKNLKEVSILNIAEIYASAFENCKKLETLIYSETVQYVAYNAFDGCIKLKEIPTVFKKLTPEELEESEVEEACQRIIAMIHRRSSTKKKQPRYMREIQERYKIGPTSNRLPNNANSEHK